MVSAYRCIKNNIIRDLMKNIGQIANFYYFMIQ